MEPTVFISYSHDDESHKDWVLQIATRLSSNGLNIILDRWNLKLGQDLSSFMEHGLSASNKIVSICSENYVKKANDGNGGVGYEKQIMTAEMMSNLNTNWVVPVIKNNKAAKKVPTFLDGRLYVSFENESLYESSYEELLRELLDEPVLPIPTIGKNPFKTAKHFSEQRFIPTNEKYVSPAVKGSVTFDYSNNNGHYFIGQGQLCFELDFSSSSESCIQLYSDPQSIRTVAIVKDLQSIFEINDARVYDGSSRIRKLKLNQIAVIQNVNGFFAAIKILDIKYDGRGSDSDEVSFEYMIQTNGSPDFTTISKNG